MLNIYKFEAMTTPCEVQLYSKDKISCDICAQEILSEVKRLELKYNYFNSSSYLSKLNLRESDILDLETKSLLQRAKLYYKKTNKIFDITVATIKEIYNLKTIKEYEKQKAILLPFVGCEHFMIKKNRLVFDNLCTKIDLGGFVKEYSVDKAVGIVKKHKIKAALINFGGDIYAMGKKEDGSKFKVGVKNPNFKNESLFYVELENEALTTSASYERNTIIEGKEFSHIIGVNKQSDILSATVGPNIISATVVSKNCVESGVYSTSLMINDKQKTINAKYLITKELEVQSENTISRR